MKDEQIEYMVRRFLAWRLPDNFTPDAGISFKPTFNDHMPVPMKHNPVGTNLFDHTQATAMVRHMIEGMPDVIQSSSGETSPAATAKVTNHIIGCARTIQSAVLVVEYLKGRSPSLEHCINYRFKNPTPENGWWSADIMVVLYQYPDAKQSAEIDRLIDVCRGFVAGRGEIWA